MAANVGVAMPRAADIVLLEDRLDALPLIVGAAQKTMRLIQSNFRIAVGVNTAILARAAFGRLLPLTAATLHNGATIGVLFRALLGGQSRS